MKLIFKYYAIIIELIKMKEEKSTLIGFLGDNPIVKVIDFLVENKGLDYSKGEIAKGSDISRTTLYKVWGKIDEMKLVKETRRFAKARLYVLNEGNPIVQRLLRLELELIKYFADVDTRTAQKILISQTRR